jgi:hemoglobin
VAVVPAASDSPDDPRILVGQRRSALSSIYERFGGPLAVEELVDRLDEQLLLDPLLAGRFADVDLAALARHQRDLITLLLGGGGSYAGRRLRVAHARLDLGERDFDAFLNHLEHALATMKTPRDVALQVHAAFASLRSDILGV